jgi:hypothetical protein
MIEGPDGGAAAGDAGLGRGSTIGAGCAGVMPFTAASWRGATGSVWAEGRPASAFSGMATIS